MNWAKFPLRSLLVVSLVFLIGPRGEAQQPSVVVPSGQTSDAASGNRQLTPTPRAAPSPWVSGGLFTANALQQSVRALDRGKRPDEIEPLVERMMQQHPGDWRVLFQGARIYAEIERSGYWVNGRYKRGDLFDTRGARRVYSHQRDHTRALQLLDRAIRSVGPGASPQELADFYWEAAQILVATKAYYGLYELTGLASLPSLEFHEPRVPERMPVPVENDGEVQFFHRPPSWDSARNDGERLLWLLGRARSLSPRDYEAEAEYIHAKYLLKSYLGVQAIAESADYNPTTKAFVGSDADRALVENLHTLGRDETVVRIAGGGLRRIKLPEEQNYIVRLSRMTTDSRYVSYAALALEELAEIFENRRQYDKAATYWQEAITRFGDTDTPGWEGDRLNQIVKSWGQFEDVRPVQVDQQARLGLWYRNGKKATLTAYRIDVDALVKDILKYLASDPYPVNPDRISVSKLGLHLVSEGREKYLKKQETAWDVELEPKLNHWDNRVEIGVPFNKPGAYLVEATIDGSHTCGTIVWINDMTILRRPLEDALFYYVADKGNGTPVSWARFSFIGFRLEVIPEDAPIPMGEDGEEVPLALRRQYHVETKEITKWADAKGQLIVDDDILDPAYRWFLLTTAPGNRAAILGFSDLHPTGTAPPVEFVGVRHFIVADRSTYLPGQTCHYRGWLREIDPSGNEPQSRTLTIPDSQPVTITLLGPNDEILEQQEVTSTPDGGFSGNFELKSDWLPGRCRLQSQCQNTRGDVTVHIESPKLAPAQLALKTTLEGTDLKRQLRTTVTATTNEGEWLGGIKVTYQLHRRRHVPQLERTEMYDWLYGAGYAFTNQEYRWFPGWKYWGWPKPNTKKQETETLVDSGQLVLSADGVGVIDSKIEVHEGADAPDAYDYVMSVHLDNAEPFRAVTTTTSVSPRPFRVFATMDRPFYKVGDDGELHVLARDYHGNPVSQEGKLVIYHVTYDDNGNPRESVKFTKRLATDERGELRKVLRAHETGQYRVTFILPGSSSQSFIEGSTVSLVVDESYDGDDARFNAFEMLSDQAVYQPGDTAQIRINTERSDQSVALFVRPRNGVFGKAEVLRLEAKSTPYEIVIQDKDAPSFFIEAIILNNGEFEVHTKEILVTPPTEILEMSLTTSLSAKHPGQQGSLTLQLNDQSGEPVAGLAAVTIQPKAFQKGFLANADIRKAFWDDRRTYEPSVEHALETRFQSFSRPPTEFMRPIGIFGSMRLHDEDTPIATPDDPMDDTIDGGETSIEQGLTDPRVAWQGYWFPDITVSAEGLAEIPITWPTNAGEWTAQVWAMTPDSQVGQTSVDFTVDKKWSLDWQTPALLSEGDTADVSVQLRSGTLAEHEVELTLTVPPELIVSSETPPQQSVRIGPKSRRVDWRVRADQPISQGTITVQVGAGEDAEVLSESVTVTPREQVSERWWNARLSPEIPSEPLEFSLPDRFREQRTMLKVWAADSTLSALLSGLNQDISWVGSAEETIYSIFPLVRLHHYLSELDDTAKQAFVETRLQWLMDDALMETKVVQALDHLATLQHEDGGWAWSSGPSQVLATATIVGGLQSLVRSECRVPDPMVSKAVQFLQSYQKARNAKFSAKTGKGEINTLDTFVYLTLLESDKDNTTTRGHLMRAWEALPRIGQVFLANALHLTGSNEDRNTIRFELGEKLEKDEETGAIHLNADNDAFKWTWYGSSIELQASYLQFLIRVKGDSPVTDAVAQYLLSKRTRSQFWNSPRDSAFALDALVAYAELKKEKPKAIQTPHLALMRGDVVLAEALPDPVGIQRLELSGAGLQQATSGDGALQVIWKGEGTADVLAQLVISETPDLITQRGAGFSIKRTYHLVDSDNTVQDEPLPPGAAIRIGQLIEVRISATAAKPMDHVRLRDTLPLGVEVSGELPSSLRRVDDRHLGIDLETFPSPPTSWIYRLKATRSGEFRAAPATIHADYQHHSKAQSDEMILVVGS